MVNKLYILIKIFHIDKMKAKFKLVFFSLYNIKNPHTTLLFKKS